MTNFAGVRTPSTGIEDQTGPATNRLIISTIGTTAYFDPPPFPVPLTRAPAGKYAATAGRGAAEMRAFRGVRDPAPAYGIGATGLTLSRAATTPGQGKAQVRINYAGRIEDAANLKPGGLGTGVGQSWFELIHVFPAALPLGNVLTTQIRTIELFNSFRRPRQSVTWTNFTNNAGAGVTITNLPTIPFVLDSFASFVANVQITTVGPPNINGTLDFTFGAPINDTFEVLVTGQRITIFQFRPQAPLSEVLGFKTNVLRHQDGTEQRIKVREAPRQDFDFFVRVDDGRSRDTINSLLFDWQPRVWGVPIWYEAKALGAPLAINDTLVTVDTADADYRVDSLVMIYDSNFYFEVLEIASFTATDITLKSGVQKTFDALNTLVMPVRTAYTRANLNNSRYAIGPSDFVIPFQTLDNIDLANASSFPTYQGTGQTVAKPVLDGLNFMPGNTIGEGYRRRIEILDPETGPQIQISPWTKGKPQYQFGFQAKSQAEVWTVRQLIHFLRGSQLSFYVPTGRTDFKPILDIGSGASSFDIENIGWTDFVDSVTPRSDLRIIRTDGTESFHQIVGSTVISEEVERISVSPVITPALPLVDIERIDILTLSRIADDKATLEHRTPGEAFITFQVTGVPS